MLSLMETNTFLKIQAIKPGLFRTDNISNIKIVFILLTKIIVIYIKLFK